MIDITVVLPDGTREAGEIDQSLPLELIKEDIFTAYKDTYRLQGEASDYELLIKPSADSERLAPERYRISSGDLLYLLPINKIRSKGYIPKK